MKRFIRQTLWRALQFIISVLLGGYVTRLFSELPFNMPYAVDRGIRVFLDLIGRNDLTNTDDMEVLALIVYWSFFSLMIGGALGLLRRLVRLHCHV